MTRNGARSPPARSRPMSSTNPLSRSRRSRRSDTDVGAGLVWSRGSTKLLGLFPARIDAVATACRAVLVGWTHPYAPLGTPLVDRDAGRAGDRRLARSRRLARCCPACCCCRCFRRQGALAAAFRRCARAARRTLGRLCVATSAPCWRRPATARDYIEQALGRKKLKELRRQLRRLGERRHVRDIARDPATVAAALGDFLALEAAGWKGRAGTAAQHDPAIWPL